LKIFAKSVEGDKLFGSVTSLDLIKKLSNNGIDIDKKCIQLSSNIKKTGSFVARVRLHREVNFDLNFEVIKAS
jgi:large subunit ribosomal protein L9